MRLVAERVHVIAEGAAGLRRRRGALARSSPPRGHRKVVAVVSGGNIDLDALRPTRRRVRVDDCNRKDHLGLERQFRTRPGASRTPQAAARAGQRSVVDLESAGARGVPPARLPALAADRAQPGADAAAGLAGDAEPRRAATSGSWPSTTRRSTRSTRARSARDTWWQHRFPDSPGPIAYFSAEFALHQSLPIYAGGLGVLAGDHCKEASDLGIPLIGVGFMYPQGYFHQSVSPEGWQQEVYERLNWADAPIEPAIAARRQAVHRRRAARQPQRAGVGVARAARPREAVPARHRSRGERAVGSRAVGAALRRRPRDAHPAGDHPRHRRRARAEGAGHRRRPSGTSTKATPRSSCCSASAT